jgi:RimJ/RimL family protein N-acetyltransferase
MRVLEKCGYRCEGRLRAAVIKDGQVTDAVMYARLRADDVLTGGESSSPDWGA